MKDKKIFDLHSTSVFRALFAFICLFIIDFVLLVFVNSFIKNQYLVYTIVYTLLAIILFIKEKDRLIKPLFTIKKDIKKSFKSVLIVVITLLIIEFIINGILIKIIGHGPSNNQVIIDSFTGANIFLILYYALIICPIVELLIYIYPYNNVKNKTAAFIIYSTIFALFHMASTPSLVDLLYFIPYLCMSFAFGYGFYKTNNIYVSIITHSLNNLLAFVLLFIM